MDAIEKSWLLDHGTFDHIILAGDIGGTHTNLALFGETGSRLTMLYKCAYATQKVSSFFEPLGDFLSDIEARNRALRPSLGCVSVAGPARNNYCKLTNAAWAVDGKAVEERFHIRTQVVNDFNALSYAIPLLDREDRNQLLAVPHSDGTLPQASGDVMAVVGAGTGLGTGFLVRHGDDYRAYPSEGGHSDFSAFDEETIELKRFVMRSYPASPGTEPFLAGRGIANIYHFYKSRGMDTANELAEIDALPESERPARISALAKSSASCRKIMQLFVRIYGKYAARAALMYLPTDGLFIAGGIVGKNVPFFLEDNLFMQSFEQSYLNNIHEVLMGIPVYIVRDYASSLYGAANAARVLLA